MTRSPLERALFPAASVLAVCAWLHLIQFLGVRDVVDTSTGAHLLFVPVVFFEAWATRRFAARRSPRPGHGAVLLSTVLAVAWWYLVFRRWSLWGVRWEQEPLVVFYGQRFWVMVGLLWRASGWMAGPALLTWAGLYGWLTVRHSRLRVGTVIGAPVALTLLLFLTFFHFGGPAGRSSASVLKQPGISLITDREELQAALDAAAPSSLSWLDEPYAQTEEGERLKVTWQPRGLVVDEGGVIVMFGCTFCVIDPDDAPMAVRIDRKTGEHRFWMGSRNLRQVALSASGFWVTPWVHNGQQEAVMLELSRRDLAITRTVPARSPVHWVPMVLVALPDGGLVVGTETPPTLHRYDGAGVLREVVDLRADGWAIEGGTVHAMVRSEATGRLYAIALPGDHDVLEIALDPLRVVRSIDLHDDFGTTLQIDDDGQKLYYHSGTTDRLARIDIATFTVDREYDGELHARRMTWDPRRRRLYALGYLTGRLVAIDVDSGERVWSRRVGGRGHGLRQRGDELFVHSMAGTFAVDLTTVEASGTR